MEDGRKAALVMASVFVLMAWSSPWFEITATGTYTEGLDREPTIRTQYAIDNDQQTFELSIDNATPLLLYWLQREDVTPQSEPQEQGGQAPSESTEEEGAEEPCSGSCMDWARTSLGLLMASFMASLVAAASRPRLATKSLAAATWMICLLFIAVAVPLAAAADFGIFSGGEGESEGSSTGGFDSETDDSVSVDQFAHFSSDSGGGVSAGGLVFTYDSVGYDLGLLEEDQRQAVIDSPPGEGEPGHESLIRFHGELVAGPGAIVSWWFLSLPLMAYLLKPGHAGDEEE
ncbi:MAG: hypothetical protein QGG21_06170 [Candidatus Thalassarchaeaceae archaeon]|jgi:hypothetical protein|nr:hypothetical protein [Candidatus Thalassarchaeaceae archaeon]